MYWLTPPSSRPVAGSTTTGFGRPTYVVENVSSCTTRSWPWRRHALGVAERREAVCEREPLRLRDPVDLLDAPRTEPPQVEALQEVEGLQHRRNPVFSRPPTTWWPRYARHRCLSSREQIRDLGLLLSGAHLSAKGHA